MDRRETELKRSLRGDGSPVPEVDGIHITSGSYTQILCFKVLGGVF